MKVIFLDIDGVLNVDNNWIDDYGHGFRTEFVSNLAMIIRETGAQIVISSSWASSGLGVLREIWLKHGLPGEIFDVVPDSSSIPKCERIDAWFYEHYHLIKSHVIIDDRMVASKFQEPYFIQCADLTDSDAVRGFGLTKRIAKTAIEILNS